MDAANEQLQQLRKDLAKHKSENSAAQDDLARIEPEVQVAEAALRTANDDFDKSQAEKHSVQA